MSSPGGIKAQLFFQGFPGQMGFVGGYFWGYASTLCRRVAIEGEPGLPYTPTWGPEPGFASIPVPGWRVGGAHG
jgi:hypothetical protein